MIISKILVIDLIKRTLIKTDEVNGCGAFTWNSSSRFCELKHAQEGSWKYCEGFNH